MSDAKVIALIVCGAVLVLAIAIPVVVSEKNTTAEGPPASRVQSQGEGQTNPIAPARVPPDPFTRAAKAYRQEQERRKQYAIDLQQRIMDDA